MQNATLFNPTDDSLESKIRSWREVQKSHLGVKASLDYSKLHGYDSALGTKEELDEALVISKNSCKDALKSLSQDDLKKARRDNLITTEEFQSLSVEKHKSKVQELRSNHMHPDEKKNLKGRLSPENQPPSHKK